MVLNSNGTNFDNNQISIILLSAVYDIPYNIPTFFEITSDDLDKYLGVYVCNKSFKKITITKNDNSLITQTTGQSSFPLEATKKGKFKFDR